MMPVTLYKQKQTCTFPVLPRKSYHLVVRKYEIWVYDAVNNDELNFLRMDDLIPEEYDRKDEEKDSISIPPAN